MTEPTTRTWEDAMLGYADVIKGIVAGYPAARILELGAGRYPSFRIGDMPGTVTSYTVNDISEDELDLLPAGYQRACFDVSGDADNFRDSYDVVFSRFLAEHVSDGLAMHRNVHAVLKKGGTAFHLIPTLYAVPFVLNKYLPERLAAKILDVFAPRRVISPKFKAQYSVCYASPRRMERMLRAIGYREVTVEPFYGHFYYERIPLLDKAHRGFSTFAAKRQWHWLATYAYIRACK